MKLNLLEVIKFRKQGFKSQQIADKFGVSISIYEKFVTKNKTNIPKPIKFKGAEENIKKWKKANPNLNFDKLASSQKSSIKKKWQHLYRNRYKPIIRTQQNRPRY